MPVFSPIHSVFAIFFDENQLGFSQTYWRESLQECILGLSSKFYPGVLTSLHSSTKTKKRSKRDMMGADSWMFCFSGLVLSYRPPTGLAAAKMDVRAFSVACKSTRVSTVLHHIKNWCDVVTFSKTFYYPKSTSCLTVSFGTLFSLPPAFFLPLIHKGSKVS